MTGNIEKWAKLLDKEYLLSAIAAGKSQRTIASDIGCSPPTLRKALRYHGISYPYILKK